MVIRLKEQFETDAAKAGSRQVLLDEIVAAFPDSTKRASLRGAFLTGPSLIEWDSVFKPAGLPSQGVTGIEIDRDAYCEVEKENADRPAGERIRLYHGQDVDFFTKQAQGLGVISLDFLQNYGPAVIGSLDALFDPMGSALADKVVLSVNMQARREADQYQWRLRLLPFLGSSMDVIDDVYRMTISKALIENKQLDADALEKSPNWQFAHEMVRFLHSYIDIKDAAKELFRHDLKFPIFDVDRLALLSEVDMRARYPLLRTLTIDEVSPILDGLKDSKLAQAVRELSTQDSLRDSVNLALYGMVNLIRLYELAGKKLDFGKAKLPDENVGFAGMVSNSMASYQVSKYKVHRYVGKSGSPMITQIFTLERDRECIQRLQGQQNFWSVIHDISFRDNLENRTFRGFLESTKRGLIKDIGALIEDPRIESFRAGQKLKSAYLRSVRDPVRGLQIGMAGEFLRSRYKGALSEEHQRMRELGKGEMERKMAKISPEIEKSLKINKTPTDHGEELRDLTLEERETVLSLHDEGQSPTSIYGLFSEDSSVSVNQIRAICAWNTMRKRKAQ